jgi:hypothetical protein
MAVLVMVIGQSGSGKSTSLRNFKDNEAFVINVSGKPMPFKNNGVKVWRSTNYQNITKAISEAPSKSIIIDDSTYLMTTEFMRTAQIKGYDKYTEMACNFYNLLQAAAALPEDKIVYFLGHVDLDANGNERFKTIGKMLDEKVTLEGWFTIVLKTVVQDGKYQFSTQTNGHDTVKSPMGMFDSQLIDNDLKAVDTAIREFYNI